MRHDEATPGAATSTSTGATARTNDKADTRQPRLWQNNIPEEWSGARYRDLAGVHQQPKEKDHGETKFAVVVTLVAAALGATAAVASPNTSSSVALRTTKVGKVLVAANGRTLYLFTADKSKSACYGQCASYWPPLIAQKPTAGAGLKASLLGTTKRRDGKLQVTYGGHPLYFFAQDKKPGNLNGQGFVHFGGAWWVVSAVGKKVTIKP